MNREERYTNEAPETTFDWFLSPTYLLPFIEELLETAGLGKEARVLMLGCGNSALGEVVGCIPSVYLDGADNHAGLMYRCMMPGTGG